MGYNSVILILNDGLSEIEGSPDHFVKAMNNAVLLSAHPRTEQQKRHGVDFHPGQSTAISCRHADITQLIAVGGNCATYLGDFWNTHHTSEGQEKLLREWADRLGFRLVRKPVKG